jgi:hypothetical protein
LIKIKQQSQTNDTQLCTLPESFIEELSITARAHRTPTNTLTKIILNFAPLRRTIKFHRRTLTSHVEGCISCTLRAALMRTDGRASCTPRVALAENRQPRLLRAACSSFTPWADGDGSFTLRAVLAESHCDDNTSLPSPLRTRNQ